MSSSILSVIIPTYCGGELLRQAIKSVKDAAASPLLDVRVIVVDNSPEMFDEAYSIESDRYCSLSRNPGFGTAANKGFEIAFKEFNSSWVMLLNPDARVATNFFEIFAKSEAFGDTSWKLPVMPLICFDYPVLKMKVSTMDTLSLIGSRISDPNNDYLVFDQHGQPLSGLHEFSKIIPVGGSLCLRNSLSVPNQISFSKSKVPDFTKLDNLESFHTSPDMYENDYIVQNAGSEIQSTFSSGDLMTGWLASCVKSHFGGPRRAWCGAGVLLPRIYLSEIGNFDESFFLYYEDTELSFRALRQDLSPILMPELMVWHKHSAITGSDISKRSKAIWRSRSIYVGLTSGLNNSIVLSLGILLRLLHALLRKRTSVSHALSHLYPEFRESVGGTLTVAFKLFRRRK